MKIERKKVSELVLEELKEMIKTGKFPPNSQLPSENELVKMFGVSRSPIREALSVLAAGGLIESRQGGRSWVREVNVAEMLKQVHFEMIKVEEVQNLLELRTIVESNAAYLAAKRHKQEDIVDLKASLEAFSQTVKDPYINGFEADYAFHRIIVRSAYNPFLTQTMDNISDLHLKAVQFSLSKNQGWEVRRKTVYAEHEKIYLAIKNRDAQTAMEAVAEHLTNARIKLGDKRVTVEDNTSEIQ